MTKAITQHHGWAAIWRNVNQSIYGIVSIDSSKKHSLNVSAKAYNSGQQYDVYIYIWQLDANLGPVYTIPFSNKNGTKSYRFGPPFTLKHFRDAPFADLLVRSNEKSDHVQHLQRLRIEMFKRLRHENPLFL